MWVWSCITRLTSRRLLVTVLAVGLVMVMMTVVIATTATGTASRTATEARPLNIENAGRQPISWDREDPVMTAFASHTIARTASAEAKLRRLRRLAWLIDGAFHLPGTRFRFGLNSLIGLTPAAGDAVLAGVSLYIVNEARRLGVPRDKLAVMLRNVAVEAIAGSVPVLGDLFDMGFKANLRNLAILEEHLAGR